ncbi:transglycosylase SLT domain-containing protein [Actinopolymorpha alba]|uniref:aggregation-promoting factor C-terminal-like domain-containing protein n=1 Tax=Actinopolymorpha alba TaxID=533267 RepID=UPI00037D5ED2|nr:transglycosylase SLT domain-containing protein [Actinopolymorpha alba]
MESPPAPPAPAFSSVAVQLPALEAVESETVDKKGSRLNPTFAAVTAASIGVTGAVGGGLLISSDQLNPTSKLVLSDLSARGGLTPAKAAALKSASPSATPRFTTRVVTSTPTATPTATATEAPVPATGEAVLDRTAVERRRAEERASRARERLALGSPKEIASRLVAARGWNSTQFECLDSIWTRESGWRITATNPSSGAYGIPQALPGRKMATAGSDWRTNPETQIKWGLNYIASRYSTPCGAWSYWKRNNWY